MPRCKCAGSCRRPARRGVFIATARRIVRPWHGPWQGPVLERAKHSQKRRVALRQVRRQSMDEDTAKPPGEIRESILTKTLHQGEHGADLPEKQGPAVGNGNVCMPAICAALKRETRRSQLASM